MMAVTIERYGACPHYRVVETGSGNIDLTDYELADFREVEARFMAWQERLAALDAGDDRRRRLVVPL